MRVPDKLRTGIKIFVLLAIVTTTLSFVEREQRNKLCKRLFVHIDHTYDNFFVEREDVIYLLSDEGKKPIEGSDLSMLDLRKLEDQLEKHKFIRKGHVYWDLKGNLVAEAIQRRPIIRVMHPNGLHAYIGDDGEILPVSERFTARVPLLGGEFAKVIMDKGMRGYPEGERVFELLQFIDNNPFWTAQIAQMQIDEHLDITMYPQVTKQRIEFGQPENINDKFKKLMVFYKEVLPYKGWNTYEKVNIKYKNQIVCE